MVEKTLGVRGDQTLYVGDHIYTDVSQSKVHLRWRTALICRELEKEVGRCDCIESRLGSLSGGYGIDMCHRCRVCTGFLLGKGFGIWA
jgi:hypothetical protein